MPQHMIECIGLLAGSIGLIAWIPQLQTVWKHRLHEGVDLRTLTIILTALATWSVYGVLREAWAVMISNLCSGCMVTMIIMRVRALRTQQSQSTQVPVREALVPNDPSKGTFVTNQEPPRHPDSTKIR